LNKSDEILKLSTLVLNGNLADAQRFSRQLLTKLAKIESNLSEQIINLLKTNNLQDLTKNVRFAKSPLPVDQDSRLELIKTDYYSNLNSDLAWPKLIQDSLNEVIKERQFHENLMKFGLKATSSILFVGEPGVGKTLAAAWLSSQLNKPFYTLDLSAVMSSYLGRTGANIRTVLDFAKNQSAVLLLDEFDAIAKRRDDTAEVGELKRLVTVLLQEIETWPQDSLLIAATNHEKLLDPAVWRRFDKVLHFPLPNYYDIKLFVNKVLANFDIENKNVIVFSLICEGLSYAIIERQLKELMKQSILNEISLNNLLANFNIEKIPAIVKSDKKKMRDLAKFLIEEEDLSQRTISEITGISRPTLSRMLATTGEK